MQERTVCATLIHQLSSLLLISGALLAGAAQAQVLRCIDTKTGEVTYTNGRCISGESTTQIQAAQSTEEVAAERDRASKAIERSQAQIAKDEALRLQRLEQERKARVAAEKAQARTRVDLENSPACRQAKERHNTILAEANPDPVSWGERSQAAQAQMEISCLGSTAYQQLQQTRALQPNAINRPQWGYAPPYHGHPSAIRPTPLPPPAKIINCNVFRCYDNRGGVHPIP